MTLREVIARLQAEGWEAWDDMPPWARDLGVAEEWEPQCSTPGCCGDFLILAMGEDREYWR